MSNPIITDNIISGNVTAAKGAGINSRSQSSPEISYNLIINNNSGSDGAGICCEDSSSSIHHNVLTGNTASGRGGAIFCGENSHLSIINNTLSINTSQLDGGGIYCLDNSFAAISNTIIWDNNSDQGSHELYLSDTTPIINYCDIRGSWPGEGNIDCDPAFCDTKENDFHLTEVSCCLGAGEGGADIGALGSDCYVSQYLVGDVNMYYGDWPPSVIGSDVTYLVNYFLGIPANQPCLLGDLWSSADVNGDCQVIGSDVTYLVGHFRGIAPLQWCPEHPPAWETTGDLPADKPEGWPYCR